MLFFMGSWRRECLHGILIAMPSKSVSDHHSWNMNDEKGRLATRVTLSACAHHRLRSSWAPGPAYDHRVSGGLNSSWVQYH